MKPKIIFFGTGEFGATMLNALYNFGYDICLVVTQPDRHVGRDQHLSEPEVKQLAKKYKSEIIQPENLKILSLSNYPADLTVVCQYGLIIPKSILLQSKHGAINVHTSLLPKFRGASPVQSAIISGETETGITIMQMDEKMDHGAILTQEKLTIDKDDDTAKLRKKMEPIAAKLLVDTIEKLFEGKLLSIPQNDDLATFCKIFTRDDGKIDWSKSATSIYNQFRGLNPWPGIWSNFNNKRIKLTKILPFDRTIEPGKILFDKNNIYIGTGNKSIQVLEIQIEGKKNLLASEFVSGHKNFDGGILL